MSNIYNQEPQAFGSILFKTTFGDLEIELFTKQCPKATKNFVQLCLDGFYQETIFERVEKGFIAVGGVRVDLDNELDTSVTEQTYPDEFHSRLRFTRRGLLASANTRKDENGSKFFFTLGATPELQGKHTIFGRLRGNTVYSLVDLNECLVDEDFHPRIKQKIIEVIVIDNPWPELKPNYDKLVQNSAKRKKEESSSDDDQEYDPLLKPKPDPSKIKKLSFDPYSEEEEEEDEEEEEEKFKEGEVKFKEDGVKLPQPTKLLVTKQQDDHEEETGEQSSPPRKDYTVINEEKELPKEEKEESKEERLRAIRTQIQNIKQQIESGLNSKTLAERRKGDSSEKKVELPKIESPKIKLEDTVSGMKLSIASERGSKKRERETLELLSKFKKKLKETTKEPKEKNHNIGEKSISNQSDGFLVDELACLDRVDSDDWLKHKFEAEDEIIMAKDANTKDDNWYSVDDLSSMHKHERHRESERRHKHRPSDKKSSSSRHKNGEKASYRS